MTLHILNVYKQMHQGDFSLAHDFVMKCFQSWHQIVDPILCLSWRFVFSLDIIWLCKNKKGEYHTYLYFNFFFKNIQIFKVISDITIFKTLVSIMTKSHCFSFDDKNNHKISFLLRPIIYKGYNCFTNFIYKNINID